MKAFCEFPCIFLPVAAFFCSTLDIAQAAKILGLLPYYGTSHNRVIMPLFEELAKRGHNVTIVGFFEPKTPSPNVTTVLLRRAAGAPLRGFFFPENYINPTFWTTMHMVDYDLLRKYDASIELNKAAYDRIFDDKYDLTILEYFESELFIAHAAKVGAPYILFHTCEPYPWHRENLGDPLIPSVVPHVYSKYQSGMGFSDRFWNTVEMAQMMIYYRTIMVPIAQTVAEKYLGEVPPLADLAKNASLYFTNTHHSLFGSRPINPSTIEVGGLHVGYPEPLPSDLKSLLDSAKKGAIFFSLGSVLKGSAMSERRRDAFVEAYSTLEEEVLWKWEDDLPKIPKNLHINPWYPQRDILAHPNIKLFISHCGLLGVHEAMAEGVPTICVPMFADQHVNGRALEKHGMAISLNYADISSQGLIAAIGNVTRNPEFMENAKRVSTLYHDRLATPMDTAVYWSEFVIRHKGASHLKSPARFLSWWEYHNLDVIATIVVFIFATVILIYKCAKALLRKFFKPNKIKKTKKN